MGDVTEIRSAEKVEPWLATLTAHESVTRMQAAAGQVLVHLGHVPSGIYIVLSGDLALSTTSDAADAWAVTAIRPYLLPHPAELDLPAGCAARVRTTVDLIHVPRSLMWLAPEVGFLLQHAPVPAVSLRSPSPAMVRTAGQVVASQSVGTVASSPYDSKTLNSRNRTNRTDGSKLSSK